MDQDVEDLMGDPICCQKCTNPITGKFYLCQQYHKWFCVDCQLVKGETTDKLCNFDYKVVGKHGEQHNHICIKSVVREHD